MHGADMGLSVRIISAALAVALACAGPADAGRRAEASAAALKREAAAAQRAAEASQRAREEADHAVGTAETRLRDVETRISAASGRGASAQSAALADRAAAARALAALSLSARGAAAPVHPGLAVLAGELGVRAAGARSQADEARVLVQTLEAERRAALAALETARADSQTAARVAQAAEERHARLLADATNAERVEEERRLADARARKKLAEQKALAARVAVVRGAPVALIHAPDWSRPLNGGIARLGAAGGSLSIAANAGADVHAPIDGEITYAGLFRTYGQVLILSGSDGYAFVLSGLDRIYGKTGQVVRRGERVGALPVKESPELGLELRKNGIPVAAERWAKDEIKPRRGVTIAERRMTASLE